MVHKLFGLYDIITNNIVNVDVGKDLKNIFSSFNENINNNEFLHYIYGAYGYSGSGKSYSLRDNKNGSVLSQLLNTLELLIISNNETSDNKVSVITISIYDYYGEMNNKDDTSPFIKTTFFNISKKLGGFNSIEYNISTEADPLTNIAISNSEFKVDVSNIDKITLKNRLETCNARI